MNGYFSKASLAARIPDFVSCHDAYLINYFNNLYGPNDLLSKLEAVPIG